MLIRNVSQRSDHAPRLHCAPWSVNAPISYQSLSPYFLIIFVGETEWSRNGRFTGISDIPLLTDGETQVLGTGQRMLGPGKLIDPTKVAHVFVSPRQRAVRTFNLLFGEEKATSLTREGKVDVTEEIAEWGYGDYEGLFLDEITVLRRQRGLDKERPWDIWIDGCEGKGGE